MFKFQINVKIHFMIDSVTNKMSLMIWLRTSFSSKTLSKKILTIVAMLFVFVILENEMFFEYIVSEMSSSRVVIDEKKKDSISA